MQLSKPIERVGQQGLESDWVKDSTERGAKAIIMSVTETLHLTATQLSLQRTYSTARFKGLEPPERLVLGQVLLNQLQVLRRDDLGGGGALEQAAAAVAAGHGGGGVGLELEDPGGQALGIAIGKPAAAAFRFHQLAQVGAGGGDSRDRRRRGKTADR